MRWASDTRPHIRNSAKPAPAGATTCTAGVVNARGRFGCAMRSARTPAHTIMKANSVPMLTNSPTSPIGSRPARIATTVPVRMVVT